MMNPVTAPYRPALAGAVALGTALLSAGMSLRLWTGATGPFDLRDVLLNARDTLPGYALPLAWLAVWAASVHTPDSAVIGAAPGRSRDQIVLRQAGVLAAATTIGWLAGWSLPGGIALATQYWTPVDLLGMAALAAAVASLVGIAFAVAMLSGVRLGAFLTPLALIAVLVLPAFWIDDILLKSSSASTQALSYVWSLSIPGRGAMLVWTTEALRLSFYLLVAFTSAKAAAGWAEHRATRRPGALANTAWLALPVSVSVVVALIAPPLQATDPNDQVTCRDNAGYTLCLFQIDEPRRAEFEAMLAPLVALVPTTPTSELVFSQDYNSSVATVIFSRLGGDRDAWMWNQLDSVVAMLFMPYPDPSERCEDQPEATIFSTNDLEASIVRQVANRAAAATVDDPPLSEQFAMIATSDGGRTSVPADQWLDQLSDAEFRDWYQQHRPLLDACTLTEQDFT